MELRQLTEAIRAHDRIYAPGSESPIWGDYLEDMRQYGLDPLDNEDLDKDIRDDVAQWWLAVVTHDWDTARATGDISEDWPAFFAAKDIKLGADTNYSPVIDDDTRDCIVLGYATTEAEAIDVAQDWFDRCDGDNCRVVAAVKIAAPEPSGDLDVQTIERIEVLQAAADCWLVETEDL